MKTFIPTPTNSKLELGFLTLHYYAIAILIGIVVAILITRARYQDRGGNPNEINDLATILIPVGIIGGRIYHVITSPDNYFGKNGHPIDGFKVWQGGLGIWGAVALGALVAFLKFRKGNFSQPFAVFADAIAPALLVAQGIGRFGNWFNAELFGKPTTLPWGLEIPVMRRPIGFENFSTFHPTFLYEALWCFAGALVLSKAKSMKKLAAGQVFLAYIFLYSLGRIWIESLRIDSAHQFIGLRLNIWVSAVAILLSAGVFLRNSRGSSNRI